MPQGTGTGAQPQLPGDLGKGLEGSRMLVVPNSAPGEVPKEQGRGGHPSSHGLSPPLPGTSSFIPSLGRRNWVHLNIKKAKAVKPQRAPAPVWHTGPPLLPKSAAPAAAGGWEGMGEPGLARSNLTPLLAKGRRSWNFTLSSPQRWHQHGSVSAGPSKELGLCRAGCAWGNAAAQSFLSFCL